MAELKFTKTPDRIYMIEYETIYQGRSGGPRVDAYLTEKSFIKRIAVLKEMTTDTAGVYTYHIIRTMIYEPKETDHSKRST